MADPELEGVGIELATLPGPPALFAVAIEVSDPSAGKSASGYQPAQGFRQEPKWGWDRAQS